MRIKENTIVSIHFDLLDKKGHIVDSSKNEDPIYFIYGVNNPLLPKISKELEGRKKGESFSVCVQPEDGFGYYDETNIKEVEKEDIIRNFGQANIKPGMVLYGDQGETFLIKDILEDTLVLDCNHIYAGKELTFNIEIVGVREATADEITNSKSQETIDDFNLEEFIDDMEGKIN